MPNKRICFQGKYKQITKRQRHNHGIMPIGLRIKVLKEKTICVIVSKRIWKGLDIARLDFCDPKRVNHSFIFNGHSRQTDQHITYFQKPFFTSNAIYILDSLIG